MTMLDYNHFVRDAQEADRLQHEQSGRNEGPVNPNDPYLRDMHGNVMVVGEEPVTLGRVEQLARQSLDYDADHPSI